MYAYCIVEGTTHRPNISVVNDECCHDAKIEYIKAAHDQLDFLVKNVCKTCTYKCELFQSFDVKIVPVQSEFELMNVNICN